MLVRSLKAVLVAVAVTTATLSAPHAAQAVTVDPSRILIVGDSVTQGKVGDHTWRYFLWNTLRERDRAVDFVGPHTGLYDPDTESTEATGYADPDFDQDHASWWGASQTDFDVRADVHDLMTTYQPDVVLDDLGINDLAYVGTPQELIDQVTQFVADVRAVNRHVSIVLGELTQTWFRDTDDDPPVQRYNALLDDLGQRLDRPDARVVVAARPSDFTQGVDTYDQAHPTESGEVKIAAQFADALTRLALPSRTPPPAPPAPAPAPVAAPAAYSGTARLAARVERRAVRLRFTTPSRATRQAIWRRDVSTGERWRLMAYVGPSAHTYRARALHRHHRYAFRLRAYRGATPSVRWSNQVVGRAR